MSNDKAYYVNRRLNVITDSPCKVSSSKYKPGRQTPWSVWHRLLDVKITFDGKLGRFAGRRRHGGDALDDAAHGFGGLWDALGLVAGKARRPASASPAR